MDRISDEERRRIAGLLAEGAPVWRLHREISPVALCHPAGGHRVAAAGQAGAGTLAAAVVDGGAGRDLQGAGGGQVLAGDRPRAGACPLDGVREVAASGGAGRYRACAADRRALRLAHRPKAARLARCPRLRAVVESKLGLRWSPEQIAGWLKGGYPGDPEMRVPHETICLSLFARSRGALRKELAGCLRSGLARRRPRGQPVRNGQGQLRGTARISQRPAEASDRAVPGHWEGDLLSGTRSSTVATLVERKSRLVMLAGLPCSHTAGVVADALAEAIATLPAQLRRSIPWDQGKEMAEHARFSVATGVSACFCDPRSPWQRGSNENTNGLLRQYFPRTTDFRALTQRDLDNAAAELNGRPRQTLGWKSPCQAPDEALQ
jgi:IS30 family transposase